MSRVAYTFRADNPAYGEWMARAAVGQATILGYSYDVDGMKRAGFTLGKIASKGKKRRNPSDDDWSEGKQQTVTLGNEFMVAAKRDYAVWKRAWWREAIQNGVDAGATRIDCWSKQNPDGTWTISVADNGKGITKRIFKDVIFKLGPSGKPAGGSSTGGFGEARRLLLFPWISYRIMTNSVDDGPLGVEGHGWEYTPVKNITAQGTGTMVEVVMPDEDHTGAEEAEWYITKCYLPKIHIFLNGVRIHADLITDKQVAEDIIDENLMSVYHAPRARTTKGFYIRTNGLMMFERFIDDKIPGLLIGELHVRSTEALMSSRDGFNQAYGSAGYKLDSQVSTFLNRITKDVTSGLKSKTKAERTIFRGTGAIQAMAKDAEGNLQIILQQYFNASKSEQKSVFKAAEEAVTQVAVAAEVNGNQFGPSIEMVKLLLPHARNQTQTEAAAVQLTSVPDFYIYNELNDWKVPNDLRPGSMRSRVLKIARLWTEFCRLVLISLGYKETFNIGWHFDTSYAEKSGFTLASYLRFEGRHWLLLNPFVAGDPKKAELYSIRNKQHLRDLFALAVHECTHMVDGVDGHDESFASAFTKNVALTGEDQSMLLIIRDAIAKDKGGEDG